MSTPSENQVSGSPGRRLRVDCVQSPSKISKHDSLYFENGNIVLLSVPNENVVTAFRVYKEFLVLSSPVFAGMLSLPSPPNTEEYENAPLVRLHDEAVDLIHFLQTIYDPTAIPSKRDFYFSPEKVESIFKLVKKYQCEKLLKCMQDTLLAIWPRNLTSWDCIVDTKGKDKHETDKEYILRSSLPETCSAIRLARDYDVPTILPAAFYRLFCLSLPTDIRYENKGLRILPGYPKPSFSYLSKDDLICLIRGSQAIQQFMHAYFSIPSTPVDDCEQKRQCTRELAKFLRIYGEDSVTVDGLSILMNASLDGYELCADCRDAHTHIIQDIRDELWVSLPALFELESGK